MPSEIYIAMYIYRFLHRTQREYYTLEDVNYLVIILSLPVLSSVEPIVLVIIGIYCLLEPPGRTNVSDLFMRN